MTLKSARKITSDTKIYYSIELANGEYDSCTLNYTGDQEAFTKALEKILKWEKQKAIVTNFGINKARGCMEIDLKIN